MRFFLLLIVFCFGFQAEAQTIVSPPQPLLVSAIVSGPPGGGGGGGGYTVPTSVTFLGRAYPLSKVSLLQDGQLILTTIAGPDSNFNISINDLAGGNYIFSLFGEDSALRKSTLFNIPLYITPNTSTTVSGIFIAPTIATDKSTVAKGDNLAIFGQSAPSSTITISIHSSEEIFKNTNSDSNGIYLLNFDTAPLNFGNHQTKSKATLAEEISSFGPVVAFNVGLINIFNEKEKICGIKADLNNDCFVNLVDFSILAYWYKRPNFPKRVDLNNDAKINLVDFSIMAYYWTG
jgi:hypothetical protein